MLLKIIFYFLCVLTYINIKVKKSCKNCQTMIVNDQIAFSIKQYFNK